MRTVHGEINYVGYTGDKLILRGDDSVDEQEFRLNEEALEALSEALSSCDV